MYWSTEVHNFFSIRIIAPPDTLNGKGPATHLAYLLQPDRRAEPGAPRRPKRWHLRRGHDAAGTRSACAGQRSNPQPGSALAHPHRGYAAAHQLRYELHDPWHLLEWPTGAVERLHTQRPAPFVDPHCVSFCRIADALLHSFAGWFF